MARITRRRLNRALPQAPRLVYRGPLEHRMPAPLQAGSSRSIWSQYRVQARVSS